MVPVLVAGMAGLGDNIYQRPIVRELAHTFEDVYVETPWPEVYRGLGVRVVRHPDRMLRTQRKHMERSKGWSRPPQPPFFRLALGTNLDQARSIIDGLLSQVAVPDVRFRFDLPSCRGPKIASNGPVAVIRPVTVRREWFNPARAPMAAYVRHAARFLRARGFYVVSVADVDPPHETFVGQPPEADESFHAGELTAGQLIGLVRNASIVVGGLGWIVPMAIATGTPLIVIGGGNGQHSNPQRVTDRRMDLSKVRWLLPDPFCPCFDMEHDCPKKIPDFRPRFDEAVEAVAA